MSMKNLFDISGRKALVTGAGRGIGKVLALTLAEAGCDVALFGLHRQNLEELAVQIRNSGVRSLVLEGDVSRRRDVKTIPRIPRRSSSFIEQLLLKTCKTRNF